jgi:AraC-like DNA-binding protein
MALSSERRPNSLPALDFGAFRESAPPSGLGDAVECVWTHGAVTENDAAAVVAPDNCADILLTFHPDGDLAAADVVGTMTRPITVGGTSSQVMGLRFFPGALACRLGIDASAVTDRRVALAELDRSLARSLGRARSPSMAVDEVVRWAAARRGAPATVRQALAALDASRGGRRIASICRDLGVSRQHLARLFAQSVGVPPKLAARVIRVRYARRLAESERHTQWSRVAASLGFADQSHLIRDFRLLTGSVPTQFGTG